VAPLELLRLLLDADRLAVAGALAARPMATDDAVAATGRDRRVVLAAIADLRSAGLVVADEEGGRYRVDPVALRLAAQAAADIDVPMDPVIGFGMTDDEREVLARMFSGRTLVAIPSNRAKRQILLQRLALEFNPGRRYTERQVNEILFTFHPDWSALRRYLVDEGFLDREHGTDDAGSSTNLYWRSGGRVTDLPAG
jgi:DNA-binding transcriptional ArsR family regulator